jgi:hypothetical protein
VQQSLMQDPTGASARKIIQPIADGAIANSEKWQTILAQQKTAQGNADRGQAALAAEQTRQSQQELKDAASKLSNAKSQTAYALAYGDLPIKLADQFPDPHNFNPQSTPKEVLRVGMSPAEIAADERNTNTQQNTAAYRQAMLAQGNQRIAISQQNADTSTDRLTKGPTANGAAVQGRFEAKQVDAARKQLDAIHQQRSAIGAALQTPDGENFVDPKTGKVSTAEMSDSIRAGLQQQLQNATNQGQRIMQQYGGDKSGNRIGQNEFRDQGGQPAQAQAAPVQAAAAKPKAQNVAPEGTIVTNPTTRQRLQKVNGQWKPIK